MVPWEDEEEFNEGYERVRRRFVDHPDPVLRDRAARISPDWERTTEGDAYDGRKAGRSAWLTLIPTHPLEILLGVIAAGLSVAAIIRPGFDGVDFLAALILSSVLLYLVAGLIRHP